MEKVRQLSLFTDKHVERNPLVRVYINPPKELLLLLRLEGVFKVKNNCLWLDDFEHWNIMRHVNGKNPIKIGRRYFYDN